MEMEPLVGRDLIEVESVSIRWMERQEAASTPQADLRSVFAVQNRSVSKLLESPASADPVHHDDDPVAL